MCKPCEGANPISNQLLYHLNKYKQFSDGSQALHSPALMFAYYCCRLRELHLAHGVWLHSDPIVCFRSLGALTSLEDLDISDFAWAGDAPKYAIPSLRNLTRLCLGGLTNSSDLVPQSLPSLDAAKGLRILHFRAQQLPQALTAVELWLEDCLQACARLTELAVPNAICKLLAARIAEGGLRVSARLRLVLLTP